MRRRIICLLALCLPFATLAQHDLSGARRNSVYTYVYKLSPKEAARFQQHTYGRRTEKYLHTPVDSFLTDGPLPGQLPGGNYLYVHAQENRLKAKLFTIDDLQCKFIDNKRRLLASLHDRQGNPVRDATVSFKGRRLSFDETLKGFPLPKHGRKGNLRIIHQGAWHQFPLTTEGYRKKFFPSLVRKISRPFRQSSRRYHYHDYFNGATSYEKNYSGYMVFSKPKYRQGDTVKLKAWIAGKNGVPVNRPMLLRLTDEDFITDGILAEVKPYRPGAFEYSFVLTDSFDLSLDESQLLTFEELKSRRYDLEEYDGDLDEDEYALKRLVTMRGKFYYEDYELSSIRFTARADQEEHHRGQPVILYCRAVDENDLPVMDGRVDIVVKPSSSGPSFQARQFFLPDTLWSCTRDLETIGETKIIFPDSIFPAASLSYTIECHFRNSNNEYHPVTLDQYFQHGSQRFVFTRNADSLQLSLLDGDRSIATDAILFMLGGQKDTVLQQPVRLPGSIPINPYASSYCLLKGSLQEEYMLPNGQGRVDCQTARTKDSIIVKVINPDRLFFWYTIFAGRRIVAQGYADSLWYAEAVKSPAPYTVSLQYVYANKTVTEEYGVPFLDRLLTIESNQPAAIYPGQVSTVTLTVKDAAGQPVPDADMTSFAYTSKFRPEASPNVPYYGKQYAYMKTRKPVRVLPVEPAGITNLLNWERWGSEMGLDTLEYFRFLHPGTLYINTEPAKDSITQVAPFVVIKGELQPVYQVYIDEEPRFFSQAQHLQRYSFPVKPGFHSISLRTGQALIRVDSVWMQPGMKSVICVNAEKAGKHIVIESRPAKLAPREMALWSRYMILVSGMADDPLVQVRQQQNLYILHFPRLHATYGRSLLVGPLTGYTAHYSVKNQVEQDFEPEGNSSFIIKQGLIKQQQAPLGKYIFSSYLYSSGQSYPVSDQVLTSGEVDSLWQDFLDHRSASEELFRNSEINAYGNGRLQLSPGRDWSGKPVFVKNIFLFRYDDHEFMRIYKGQSTDLGYLSPGMYRVMLLLRGNQYFVKDSIRIRKAGINYYETGIIIPKPTDSMSMRMAAVIEGQEPFRRESMQAEKKNTMLELFNNRYLDISGFQYPIYGTVSDRKTGQPLTGAVVMIRGTGRGTVVDAAGNFYLNGPQSGTLVISMLGYETVEKRIGAKEDYTISLKALSQSLEEVVVVGYGTTRKKTVTASATTFLTSQLTGKVAGIFIRGTTTIGNPGKPLILLDGLPYSGDLQSLDPTAFASINTLTAADAMAIYGNAAADGVIIITTRKATTLQTADAAGELPQAGNSLRRNFRDDAYWYPALRTDKEGRVRYSVAWPDDITSWKTFAIAMDDHKRSGMLEGAVRSFKALSASLALPQFLTVNDSINVLGKTLHYGTDSITLNRKFYYNDRLLADQSIGVRNAAIDTFLLQATDRDSVSFRYTITQANGYFDGEERTIPVFKQGVMETTGFFATLEKDTSFTVPADPRQGELTIHAESSLLPVMVDEIDRIRDYAYLCNEQLASKLKALLLKKKVYEYLKKDFREGQNILDLIGKLQQNRLQSGLWAWWNNDQFLPWISLHVTEALLMAEKQGYAIRLDKTAAVSWLSWQLEQYQGLDRLFCLRLLHALGAPIDFQKQLDSLQRSSRLDGLYPQLRLLEFRQELGLGSLPDSLVRQHHATMFGNIYYGEDGYRFFDNSIQNTLLMYRMMKRAGGYETPLKKIRQYFLEKRKDGQWRNTYESCLILETILPDLLTGDPDFRPATMVVEGEKVSGFPYSTKLAADKTVTVHKQGDMPVYFTAYQQHWNPQPEQVNGDFAVRTSFEQKGVEVQALEAGVPAVLQAEVRVKGDADYVMVEIPIPAGCSYKDKEQPWTNNEVHREYFRNKVSIFCSSLRQGKYIFRVSLLPRYTGSYHLNPAKAEMMYFPVFYGREGMKKTQIR